VGRRKQQKANTTTEKVKIMPERGHVFVFAFFLFFACSHLYLYKVRTNPEVMGSNPIGDKDLLLFSFEPNLLSRASILGELH